MRLIAILFISSMAAALGCNIVKDGNVTGIKGSGNLKNESRNLAGFKKIKAGGAVKLDVTIQSGFSVSVETDDNLLEHIVTEVKGDTLTIESRGKISPSDFINVKVTMPEVTNMDLSGASTGVIADIKTEDLKLVVSGASKIQVSGEVKRLVASVSGASGVDAEGLRTENADVDASGASNATVNAVNIADLTASGASSVYYVGDPKNLTQNSSGVSSIKKK